MVGVGGGDVWGRRGWSRGVGVAVRGGWSGGGWCEGGGGEGGGEGCEEEAVLESQFSL